MNPDKQFVFIVGAPRSGSTWLQAMLGAHSDVCTFGELQVFNFYTVPWEDAWNRQVALGRYGLPTVWTRAELQAFLEDFVERTYRRVSERNPGASVFLDKHPAYSHYIAHIDALVPNARYVHIIRDGRDVAASLLAASKGWGALWAPGDARTAARTWKRHVVDARSASGFTDRYLEVRYEDLLADGPAELGRIFAFMGCAVDPAEIHTIYEGNRFEKMREHRTASNGRSLPPDFFRTGRAGGWRAQLGPKQRLAFASVADGLLRELGYADENWWADSWPQRYALQLRDPRSRRRLLDGVASRTLGRARTDRIRAVLGKPRRQPTGSSPGRSAAAEPGR